MRLLERYLELSDGDDPDRVEAVQGTLRLFRELEGRRVWIADEVPQELELPLSRIWDGSGRTQGFVITAKVGEQTLTRSVLSGTSYISQNDFRQHFGLGDAKKVDLLEVRWPDGSTTTRKGVAAGQILVVKADE